MDLNQAKKDFANLSTALKSLPNEFWLEVGTAIDKGSLVKDYEFVTMPPTATCRGGRRLRQDKDPDIIATVPEYRTYWELEKKAQAHHTRCSHYEDRIVLEKMQNAHDSLWNRLRRKARRNAGVDVVSETAKKQAADQKKKEQEHASQECSDHIRDLINHLIIYQKKAEQGQITRASVRKVFDMTNKLTSLNKKLKDAYDVR